MNLKGKKILSCDDLGNGDYQITFDDDQVVIAHIVVVALESKEESDDEDDSDADSAEYTVGDLQEMDISELQDLCKENGIKFKKKATEDDLIELLKEKLGIEDEDEDDDSDDDDEDSDDEDDDDSDDDSEITWDELKEMDKEELIELCEENDVEFKKKDSEDDLRKKFAAAFDIEIPKKGKK